MSLPEHVAKTIADLEREVCKKQHEALDLQEAIEQLRALYETHHEPSPALRRVS